MLTLLLAAAACADPTIKCDGFGNSASYDVPNAVATTPALGFTAAGEGVVAVCVKEPGSDTSGFVHLLDAYTGDVRQVTTAKCAALKLGDLFGERRTMKMNGQSVVSVLYSILNPTLSFLPLNGGTPFTFALNLGHFLCSTGPNGESLTAVGTTRTVEVRDNHNNVLNSLSLADEPSAVAVSKRIGGSSSSDYYIAVLAGKVLAPLVPYVAVYHSNGNIVANYTVPEYVKGIKFRDQDNSLVVAGKSQTIMYNIDTGARTTFTSRVPSYSVAFNADGSKMAVYVFDPRYRSNIPMPYVYIKDLNTGGEQALCTVDGGDRVSLATDGQGRSVVLAYSWKGSSVMRVSVFNVPDETDAPETAAPDAIAAPIIGGVLGGVALLVAIGVGFWLWKKRQAVSEETYVDMPTVN